MPFPRKLRRKSEKISLAFEYVHDRFSGLPKYSHQAFSFFKRFGVVLFCAVSLGILPFAFSSLKTFGENLVPAVREAMVAFLPKELPQITAGKTARNANAAGNQIAREVWQETLENVPVRAVSRLAEISDLVKNHPEIFERRLSLDFSDLWSFQEEASTPYGTISLSAGRLARSVMIPFATNQKGFPSRVEAEIALLKAIANINRTDFNALLRKAPDRRKALEDYLARGKNLEMSGRRNYFNILARRENAQERDENLETSAREREQEVFAALNNFAGAETEQKFEAFVDTRKKTVLSGAEGGFLTAMEQKYSEEVNFLSQKLRAIEKNREALIANVVVTPTPGINLGLIQPIAE